MFEKGSATKFVCTALSKQGYICIQPVVWCRSVLKNTTTQEREGRLMLLLHLPLPLIRPQPYFNPLLELA